MLTCTDRHCSINFEMDNINCNSKGERCRSDIAFADLQGFFDNCNGFVIKEFSFIHANSLVSPHHFIFKPPYSWNKLNQNAKRRASYLLRFHHGLNWESGSIDYKHVKTCIDRLLLSNVKIIYVKGLEKIKWLQTLCPSSHVAILDMDDMQSLNNNHFKQQTQLKLCAHHNNVAKQCAFQNVLILKDFYMNK